MILVASKSWFFYLNLKLYREVPRRRLELLRPLRTLAPQASLSTSFSTAARLSTLSSVTLVDLNKTINNI